MNRTVNSCTYSGKSRTAIVEEITTLSEDLSSLSGLYAQLSGIEHRIETGADTSPQEMALLLEKREELNNAIAEMKEFIEGYDRSAE